ncbi:hypothetical protein [Pedobacter alpinus]|uniref:Lipoprotein n=1 Tax=Pedobacter alpinus TaxID=1590643 RepID=A0ABW5TWW6_9SPHI
MKNIGILLLLIFCFGTSSYPQSADSLKNNELAKKYFLNNYGNDEHAKAIIEYAYRKCNNKSKNLTLGIGLSAVSLLAYSQLGKTGDMLDKTVTGYLTLPALWIGLSVLTDAIISNNDLNPKKLNIILKQYKSTGKLPKMFNYNKRHAKYRNYLPNLNTRKSKHS